MFKIKGSCTIKIIDSRTGKVKQVLEKENLITNGFLHSILSFNPYGWLDRFQIGSSGYETDIFISADTATPVINGSPSVMAQAYTPSGVTKKTFYPNANPIYGQLQQRIDFTGTARTFQTVGLREGGTRLVQAYLLLDTPCVQGAFDYLDLFYRVQFINDGGEGFPEDALLDFAKQSFAAGFFSMSSYAAWVGAAPASDSPYNRYASALSLQNRFSGNALGSLDGSVIHSHYKYKMTNSFGQNTVVGFILGCITQGNGSSGGYYTIKNVVNPNAPFQNIFTHSANATVPFFDSLATAGGNGKVRTSGNWTGKFPELYKITIVQSGAVGVATYKYSVRKHLGFDGNTYSDLSFNSPYRIDLPGFHGMKEEDNDLLRWSNTQIVQYDQTGVMLLDVFDGSYKIWDSTTLPALPVTQLRQCAVDTVNQKIYAACRVTGLWVIDVTNNAIAQPLTNPCYGVDVGRDNVAFALVENGLYRSSDWSTPLNFTYAGITDANWSKAYFLKADPESIEDRLAIVMQPATAANRRVVWHRLTPPIIPAGTFQFSGFGDAEGMCYWIGTNYGTAPWTNPHDAGRVTVVMSTVEQGTHSNMVNRQGGQNNHTQDIANSWIAIDLGSGNTLAPNYYILQNREGTGHLLRNWKLQGSNNVTGNTVAALNTAAWTDLDTRVNDTSISNSPNAWGGFTCSTSQGYRWLRILQTGLSSSNSNYLVLAEFEFYGTFSSTATSRIPPARQSLSTYTGAESSNIKAYPASLDVADTDGFWVCGAGKLDFGGGNLGSLGGTLVTSITYPHSIYGSDTYYKIAFYNQYLILRDRIVSSNGSTVNTFADLHVNITSNTNDFQSSILHLDNGIVILSRRLRQLFTDNAYCYSNYGWNGNNWELNHPGAKTTHSDSQLLGNGINIRFENGANAPHFVGTDFYTQSICYGKHKDNASTISHSTGWYSKPVKFDYLVQAGLTVPASPTNPIPTPTRYWRVRNLSQPGAQGYWAVRELIFRDEAGKDITTGGVGSASTDPNNVRYLFDKGIGNLWYGNRYSLGDWMQYTFPNPVVVYSVSINNYADGSYSAPTDYTLEYSTDAGATWLSAGEYKIGGTSDNIYYTNTIPYNTYYEVYLDAKNDAYFLRIETDSPELIKLTLNGQPLATTYTESILPPGVNEAVVFGNGRVKFNAANAGATVGGAYAWVKN